MQSCMPVKSLHAMCPALPQPCMHGSLRVDTFAELLVHLLRPALRCAVLSPAAAQAIAEGKGTAEAEAFAEAVAAAGLQKVGDWYGVCRP